MIIIELITALQKQMNFCKEKSRYKCGIYVRSNEQRKIVMDVISNIVSRPNRDVELRMGINCAEARYKNGSLLKIILANDSARMNHLNGLIIDNEISVETINCVIMPTIIFNRNDNPTDRIFYVDISMDDVNKFTRENQLIYVSSRGSGNTLYQYQRDLLDAMSYSIQFKNNNYINFKKEYECMFYENDYDRPVVEKEINGDKVMLYEAWGIPKNLITYSTEFVNKTRQTYLNVSGKYEIPDLGFENGLNIHLLIDTKIYDGYKVHVEDGLVTVVLHEIKNKAPVLKDYGVA